ncbi:MAG: cyclic pyranopterin monophosphate synthase MoaC [Gammaproteobacteria bacterium]|nr:cyclic pyranopterin monophosphate synthase MoaC [Gammaproteobacteria bacterium]
MPSKPDLTHFNDRGEAHMVNVGNKAVTDRKAVAEGRIVMADETLEMIRSGGHKKGDVLGIARTAGIMAAKKTSELIPLCHSLMLTRVHIDFELDPARSSVVCIAATQTTERTGVEMEALTAVLVTLLTIYDMCKAVDRSMQMQEVRLVHKSGGRSGTWNRE